MHCWSLPASNLTSNRRRSCRRRPIIFMNFCQKHSSYKGAAKIQAEVAAWTAKSLDLIPAVQGPVLELGAGTGLFTQYLAEKFSLLAASDLSKAMIEEGKKAVPKASWQTLDAWNLTEVPKWNGLFSSSLLQWCPNPEQMFRQWNKLLQPEGWMLHSCFTQGTLQELQDIAPECLAVEFHPPQLWAQSLEDAGFEVLQMETREDVYTYPTALAFFRNLHDLGATTPNKIPHSKLRRIVQAYDSTFATNAGVPAQWNSAKFLCQKRISTG